MRGVVLLSMSVLLATAPAHPQATRVVAVAEFTNRSVDSGSISTALLSDVFQQLLAREAAGRLRFVGSEAVRNALRSHGYTAADLASPARAREVAESVGADWLVTGRWTHLYVVSRSTPDDPPTTRSGDAFAYAAADVRVLDTAARRTVFDERFTGQANGGDTGALLLAATEALHFAARRIARL